MNDEKRYGRRSLRTSDLKFIADVVWKAFSVAGIEKRDFADIEHELVLILTKRARKYDSRVNSWKTFRAVVVQRALTDYIRKHNGQESYSKRMAAFSLDDLAPGSKSYAPVFYRDLVNSDGVLADGTEKDDTDQALRCMDVRAAISAMPKSLQKICRAIMDGHNKTELSRRFRISRPTLDSRFEEIRKVLILHGF